MMKGRKRIFQVKNLWDKRSPYWEGDGSGRARDSNSHLSTVVVCWVFLYFHAKLSSILLGEHVVQIKWIRRGGGGRAEGGGREGRGGERRERSGKRRWV